MLNRNIDSILYQSYIKLGDIAFDIAKNAEAGLADTKEQKDLWNQAIIIYSYLECIGNHTDVVDGSVYRILNIEVVEMNKLLSCLVEISEIYDYPVAPFIPQISSDQIVIGAGLPGNPGTNGTNAYNSVAYAADDTGTDFSAVPDPSRPYVAFKTSTSPIPFLVTSFTGLWVKFIGDDGADGDDGNDGADGNTILSGVIDPTTEGVDGDYYINTLTLVIFGPKAGTWPSGTPIVGEDGDDGADGDDGLTLLNGVLPPDNGIGENGDFYIDTNTYYIYGPKALDAWPIGVSLIGPPGNDGADGDDGNDGSSKTTYMAWADDASGTGFTLTFDPTKDYIAMFVDEPDLTVVVTDFDGLWARYRGDGDNWATTSVSSMTIGTGIQNLVVDLDLAYTTGQRIVIALDDDEDNRMEGYCRSYDPTTGQLVVDIDTIEGAGTYEVWDVNLFGVPVQVITTDSYFGEIFVEGNTGGTPQTLSTTPVAITQFTNNGANSAGVTLNFAGGIITPSVRGAYIIKGDFTVSGDATEEYIFNVFKNGVPIAGTSSRITTTVAGDKYHVAVHTVQEVDGEDELEIRIAAAAGTPDLLIEEGRLSVHTTGSPSSPDFTTFENTDVDTGTETVDSFTASLAYAVEFDVVIRKGSNRRKVKVGATWEGTNVNYDTISTIDIGTVDIELSVDISGGNVRLLATAISDDWIVSGNRTLIK